MPFFTDVDAQIQRTIERVEGLEEQQAKKLLRRFREIRRELRDRLDVFPTDSFSAQQTRGVLVQIDAALIAINQSLKEGMREAASEAALLGGDDLVREVRLFEKKFTGATLPLDINTALIAEDVTSFLFNRMDASIDAYTEDVRALLAANLTNLAIQEVPFDTMIRKMSQFFIGEEWKLRRIARTELHNIYNLGKLKGMEQTKEEVLPDLQKTLIHPLDTRTGEDSKQLAEENPIVDIDKPFRFTFTRTTSTGIKRETREFMAPPDRPNDRAILVPFRAEWNVNTNAA